MNSFLKNWTYPKHAAAVTALYATLAIAGNWLLSPEGPRHQRTLFPCQACSKRTQKRQRFNTGLAVLYGIDMSATYLLLDHLRNKCQRAD